MKQKRILCVFAVIMLAFCLVEGKVFLLSTNQSFADKAENQAQIQITLSDTRGNIYDRKGKSFTGGALKYYALSIPGENNYTEIFSHTSYSNQNLLYKNRNSSAPFLIEVNQDLSNKGIRTFAIPQRYSDFPLAQHLIGYVDSTGRGVCGIEKAYEDVLYSKENNVIKYAKTAQGNLIDDKIIESNRKKKSLGIVLTLDKPIQKACEGISAKNISQGCIIVLESKTAKILACTSIPGYNPNAIYKSIQSDDTSLLNRAFCEFSVGSVFKPILAAAAIEKGWDWYSYKCDGFIQIKDQIFHCAAHKAHGKLNIEKALCESCNCFFIDLGQKLNAKELLQTASLFRLGKPIYLGGNLKTADGNLPSEATLQNAGQLANMSFGQGLLAATPLQVAAAMNVLASDGRYRSPQLIAGIINEENGKIEEQKNSENSLPAIKSDTAAYLRKMLKAVVNEGIGQDAMPTFGGAGGKTGTAQTGSFDETGKEKMNYWFAGFYPAEKPEYTIVVMQDGVVKPRVSSGKIFAQVCDVLYWLEKSTEKS